MPQRQPRDNAWLRVGEVGRRTGLTVRTLHHYDQLGLLVPSGRSDGDYRLYDADDLRRLLAIQHLKSLGLSLDDIAAALDDPTFDARDAVERHIALVEERLGQERELLARLRGLREASETGWEEVLDVIALTERLRHPDPTVRVRAALDAPTTAPVSTRDAALCDAVATALARFGASASGPLIEALDNQDAAVRSNAADALALIGDPVSAAPLADTLDDADPTVRFAALFALGGLLGETARNAIAGAVESDDARVRALATRLLADR
jgi:DNA-binding transcriptional MerR regulator